MSDLVEAPSNWWIIDNVLVFASEDEPDLFYYLPLRANPVLTDQGRASGQLIEAGDSAFLMLSAQWDLPANRFEALRAEVLAKLSVSQDEPQPGDGMPPDPIRLAFASVTDVKAVLELIDQHGASQVISESSTSGMPPYNCMFNLSVTGEPRDAALAAMNGRHAKLQVRFEALLTANLKAAAVIEGDLSHAHDRASLEKALDEGAAVLTLLTPVSGAFFEMLIDRAVEMLIITPAREGRSKIAVEFHFDRPVEFAAKGDVGAWFADQQPAVLPTAGSPPGAD